MFNLDGKTALVTGVVTGAKGVITLLAALPTESTTVPHHFHQNFQQGALKKVSFSGMTTFN